MGNLGTALLGFRTAHGLSVLKFVICFLGLDWEEKKIRNLWIKIKVKMGDGRIIK
jgi:hypothetical protein